MKHSRVVFFKDLDRLRYRLDVPTFKIRRVVFLVVVNELGYVTRRQQWKNLVYDTLDGTWVECARTIPATEGRNGCPYPLQMPEHSVSWRWECQGSKVPPG